MNQAHLHLIINHLPIMGSLLGCLVLAYGIWVKSSHTILAGYGVLIIATIGVIIAYITGESAEEIAEKIPGIYKQTIEQHSDFAIYTMIVLILSGLGAIMGILLTLRKSKMAVMASNITLCIALVGFGLAVRTGYQGGQIRHTEFSTAPFNPTEGNAAPEKGDKD